MLDELAEQVHGPGRERPDYLDPDAELVVGDVRDAAAVERALRDVDVVFHLAARVGVGQSMYAPAEYTDTNNRGTAVLLEAMMRRHQARPFHKLVVASSMSVYGEGRYRDPDGRPHDHVERRRQDLAERRWEPRAASGEALSPLPTPEDKPPHLASLYALSKYDQERMCLMFGQAYENPTVALRFFNVYGTRQALSNPYTGVLAIFASRLLNGRPPRIFEDGQQRRDFVHVFDVARAWHLALARSEADGRVLNVGSGQSYTVREIRALGEQGVEVTLFAMGGPAPPCGWAEAAEIPTLTLIETDHRLEWMEEPWSDVDDAGRRLLELEREIRPDVVHLNGYAHAALPFAAPKLVVGHSCVLSWWQAVHGVPAPARWDVYRQRVRRGLSAADLVLAPTWAMLDALERLYGPFASSGVVYNGRPGDPFAAAAKEDLVFAAGRLWDPAKNLAALEAVAGRLSWPIVVAGPNVAPGKEAAAGDDVEPETTGVRRLGRLTPEEVAGWLARASMPCPPATSRSACRCSRRPWPAARWCWGICRACASCGAMPPVLSTRKTPTGWRRSWRI